MVGGGGGVDQFIFQLALLKNVQNCKNKRKRVWKISLDMNFSGESKSY